MKKAFSIFFAAALVSAGGSSLAVSDSFSSEELANYFATQQDTVKKGQVLTRSEVYVSNDGKDKGNHVYINTDEGKRMELTYKGKIALTEDGQAIKSISPGGSLKYVQSVNDFTRRIELKSDANGTITRTYSVNGKETAYEPEGRKWLQQIMPELMATTGIGVEEKVREVYNRSGARGVLAEAEKVSSEQGKTRYINLLLEQPELKPADVKAVLEFSSKHINSDYERSKTLRKITKSTLVNKDVTAAYLNLTNSISSDYERGKALAYLIENTALNEDNVNKIVATTGKLSSDYEKNKVLKKLVEQPNYLKGGYSGSLQIINNFSSDYEKGKAITNILNSHKLANAQYQELLPVVSKISSDYEKSKVLRNIAPRIPADATALREQYVKATQTIGSEYETKKAMDALGNSR